MNDHVILGLPDTYTKEELKKAYHSKAKEFHPDKNENKLQNHLAMIRLNQAYTNLKSQHSPIVETDEIITEDQVYNIYKKGIELFQSIHPSKWKRTANGNIFSPDAIETDENAAMIIEKLLESMSSAYHCFSQVVNEYSFSCWAADSKSKLTDLEKMTHRYIKILNSYKRESK